MTSLSLHRLPSLREPSLRERVAAFLVVALVALYPGRAHADLYGADLGFLSALVTQGAANFGQLVETVKTAVETMEETKKYVGMAEDAVNAFKDFQEFGSSIVSSPESFVRSSFPELGYFQDQLAAPQSWGRGTGELQRLMRLCLQGGGKCAEVRAAVTSKQAQESISDTFGTAPQGHDDIATMDVEAARAISHGSEKFGRASVSTEQSRALVEKCVHASSDESIAACQAAANTASILQLEQTSALNEQAAVNNRLQAIQMANDSAERKRVLREQLEREQSIRAGAAQMKPPEVQLKTEGFDFWGGGNR